MKYIILAEDGQTVIQAGNTPSLPSGAIEVVTPYTAQEMAQCLYVERTTEVEEVVGHDENGDEITETVTHTYMTLELRPTLEPLQRVGNQVMIPNIPLGSQIIVHDEIGGEILVDTVTVDEDYLLDVTFPDAGLYAVDIYPPHPYLPATHKIEVTS